MEEDMLDENDDHSRTIIHIDIDCFYAQVEELRNPLLKRQPMGIQQKNIIVTSNYVAREYGIGKLMLLSEAQKLCPNLVLVNGEDLTPYRKMSANIFDILTTFTTNVEKLGLDENYLDVTLIVNQKLAKLSQIEFQCQFPNAEGFVIPENYVLTITETTNNTKCHCGCEKRLIIASHLANEIRRKLFTELGITCCAGVAHNKLLAKIIGAKNKPNKQTILVPLYATQFMSNLESLRSIVGIGEKTDILLKEIGVKTVRDLQEINVEKLLNKFNHEMAMKLKNSSYGKDNSVVKPSGRPKSISLEDSCKSISLRADVEEKFRLLLIRLINQATEDGRIPIVIKIILRKYDSVKKTSHRETKQANIMPSMFKQLGDGKIIPNEGSQEKLLKIVMRLFERSVDLKRPFNITLLGLAFSKFQEKKKGSKSIANFLIKKSDVEVQSITSLCSDGLSPNFCETNYYHRYVTSSPMHMDFESISDTSHASYSSDVSESEIEPSPKKTRIGLLIAKRRCFTSNDAYDAASPSKLRVSDLRLNSKEFDRDYNMSPLTAQTQITISTPNQSVLATSSSSSSSSLILLSPPSLSISSSTSVNTAVNSSSTDLCTSLAITNHCPPSVDQSVFKELPMDVQQELLAQWRTVTPQSGCGSGSSNSSSSSSNSSNSSGKSPHHSTITASATATAASSPRPNSTQSAAGKNNTLHRYFITNKQH